MRRRRRTAVNCGTPTPATMRVVQIEPGPDADLDARDARLDQRLGALGRGHVAPDQRAGPGEGPASISTIVVEYPLRVAVGRVDDDDVDAGVDQRLGPLEPIRPHAHRRAAAQAPQAVLARVAGSARSSRCP